MFLTHTHDQQRGHIEHHSFVLHIRTDMLSIAFSYVYVELWFSSLGICNLSLQVEAYCNARDNGFPDVPLGVDDQLPVVIYAVTQVAFTIVHIMVVRCMVVVDA